MGKIKNHSNYLSDDFDEGDYSDYSEEYATEGIEREPLKSVLSKSDDELSLANLTTKSISLLSLANKFTSEKSNEGILSSLNFARGGFIRKKRHKNSSDSDSTGSSGKESDSIETKSTSSNTSNSSIKSTQLSTKPPLAVQSKFAHFLSLISIPSITINYQNILKNQLNNTKTNHFIFTKINYNYKNLKKRKYPLNSTFNSNNSDSNWKNQKKPEMYSEEFEEFQFDTPSPLDIVLNARSNSIFID